ncbi:hypothetical protein COY16_01590 [Candidatus Roizmanbacteria bacterium CG_4_10_14_0_2_um_filter_39_13]|uniref:Uncharacterized protein n=1 Tax=Candidatus Roizmanbacteria bacterium CG_4_10_14_0_2_um_filter_39_13 TaxID=1974825 RepID=A0A2M7U0G0_9BACT|nr:MAG: hypothetical protein COY16_01590 [Candidatus Roizmanbacteria bacterium CG_4_10_14_0_2_um_filter_39_13]
MRSEQYFSSELQERLRQVNTLFIDVDQCIYPGPDELNGVFTELAQRYKLIPCTSRSLGEMEAESYPGKDVLLASSNGIFEAGLMIKVNGEIQTTCGANDLQNLDEIRKRLRMAFIPIGPRNTDDKYSFGDYSKDPNAFGSFPTNQKDLKPMPFVFSNYPNQLSVILWPSGNARECPTDYNYFACADFVESLRNENPKLFNNISITRTDGSVLIRPNSPNNEIITKLHGVQSLQTQCGIATETSLFIGDDEQMDLPVAQYISKNGGLVVVPENASEKIKLRAGLILPGYAGSALMPFLQTLTQI